MGRILGRTYMQATQQMYFKQIKLGSLCLLTDQTINQKEPTTQRNEKKNESGDRAVQGQVPAKCMEKVEKCFLSLPTFIVSLLHPLQTRTDRSCLIIRSVLLILTHRALVEGHKG